MGDVDNNPAKLPMTVSSLGHFVFKEGDSKTLLTSLNVEGSDTGTFHVENVGITVMSGFGLTLPAALRGNFLLGELL